MSRVPQAAFAAFFVFAFGAVACGQTAKMLENLARMRNQWGGNPKDLEAPYNYMTSAAASPMEKGIVYQNMVSMFAQKGTRTYADDIAKYSEKALELPYRAGDLAQMYLDVGDGIIADAPKAADGTAELKESDRTDVAKAYLRALRILLDTISFDDAPTEEVPGASDLEAKTALDRNNMVARKDTCLAYLRELYGDDPAELAKLRDLAAHELGVKGREEMLLKAMRGEKTETAKAVLASLPQSAAAGGGARSVEAPAEGSSLGFEVIGALAVAGIAGLFWFMKKRAFFS
jgi:hypothetical protein